MGQDSAVQAAGPSQPARRKRTHKQRFSRSRTGCLTCRGRRIRCDETHPTCERCVEIEATCVWPPNVKSAASSSGRPSRQSSHSRQVSPNPLIRGADPGQGIPVDQGSASVPAALPHINGNSNGDGIHHMGSSFDSANRHGPLDWSLNSLAGTPSFDLLANSDTPWDINLGTLLPPQSNTTGNPHNPGDLFAYTLPLAYTSPGHDSTIPGLNSLPNNHTSPGMSNTDLALYNNLYSTTPHMPSMDYSSHHLATRRTDSPTHTFNPHINNNHNPLPTFNMPLPLFIPSTISEPIEQVFPSADSKRIFQHVRSATSTIVVALGLGGEANNNHTGKNPFMAMALRTILMDATSNAQTAFRHALLSLGATHVCHQYQKTSPEQCQQMRVRTIKSKRKALAFLSIGPPTLNGDSAAQTDLVLATCLTLCLRNTLSGDPAWKPTLDFALRHIARRGGVGSLLSEPSLGPDRRFLVEQIAVADLFSTFTTGQEPVLLGQSAAWWSEAGPQWSETQWEAYERYLGISREMTEYVAKYRIICARKLQLQMDDWPAGAMLTTLSDSITHSVESLLDTLKAWETRPPPSFPQIKRIQDGDSAYRHMMEISLLTEVQSLDMTDHRVQSSVQAVLRLCSDMSQEPVNLLWPLMTAGACCTSVESRNWVRQLFDVFRSGYCRDLEIAETLLLEQWTRVDCKAGITPWPRLMKDMGLRVCLI